MNTLNLMLLIMITGLGIILSGPIIFFINNNVHNNIVENLIIVLPLYGSFQILFGVSVPFWYKEQKEKSV